MKKSQTNESGSKKFTQPPETKPQAVKPATVETKPKPQAVKPQATPSGEYKFCRFSLN